jgi:hypothetical protein
MYVPGGVSEPVHSRTLGHTLHTIMYFKVFYTNFHFKFMFILMEKCLDKKPKISWRLLFILAEK